MMHSIDAHGRLRAVTDDWLARLGYQRDEVIGRRSTEFLTEASKNHARRVLVDFFETGECRDVAYEFVRKDGTTIDVLLSATSQLDSEGGFVGSVAVLRDVTAERRAHKLACVDDLTGLLRRREFERQLSGLLSRPVRREALAVGFVDVDDFKSVNDRLGHIVGDQALVAVADTLRQALRQDDLCARFGGDEFAFALDAPAHHAHAILRRVTSALSGVPLPDTTTILSASVGYTLISTAVAPCDLREVLERADAAMYASKAARAKPVPATKG